MDVQLCRTPPLSFPLISWSAHLVEPHAARVVTLTFVETNEFRDAEVRIKKAQSEGRQRVGRAPVAIPDSDGGEASRKLGTSTLSGGSSGELSLLKDEVQVRLAAELQVDAEVVGRVCASLRLTGRAFLLGCGSRAGWRLGGIEFRSLIQVLRGELASAKLAVESAKKVTSEAAAAANKRLVELKAKHEAASEQVIALEHELKRAAEGNKEMTTQTPPSLFSSAQGKMSLGLNVLLALTLLAVLRLHGGGGRGGKRAKQGEYME